MLSTAVYLVSMFSLIVFVFTWGAVSGIKLGLTMDSLPLIDMRERLGVVLITTAFLTGIFFVIGAIIK
jgi:hypothetical protein